MNLKVEVEVKESLYRRVTVEGRLKQAVSHVGRNSDSFLCVYVTRQSQTIQQTAKLVDQAHGS